MHAVVHSADQHTTIRADRILALRVTIQPGASEIYGLFHLDADPVGEHGTAAVRLCSVKRETFPEDVPDQLAGLIDRHSDDPDGASSAARTRTPHKPPYRRHVPLPVVHRPHRITAAHVAARPPIRPGRTRERWASNGSRVRGISSVA